MTKRTKSSSTVSSIVQVLVTFDYCFLLLLFYLRLFVVVLNKERKKEREEEQQLK